MIRLAGAALAVAMLGGCAGKIIPPSTATRPPVARASDERPPPYAAVKPRAATPMAPAATTPVEGNTARTLGIVAGPPTLPMTDIAARRALTAFRLSCPSLVRRSDASGLTKVGDWSAVCDEARRISENGALDFFANRFEAVQIGSGTAFATGYYEPEIAGSRVRDAQHQAPIYRRPDDLTEVDLGQFAESLKGKKIRGHVVGRGFEPYPDRAAIENGALAGKGLEIAWAADPVELFFLQVQGSGRLRLPDGGVMRIGYDSQNGRDYTGIGKLMKDRGLLEPGQSSMQGIMAYLRAHPQEGRAIMRENKSWVFFRELTGAGAVGAMGVVVIGQASVAADPAFVPLGAPVFLSMDRTDATGLWVAQDTGGAIKGANRFDTFWGAGDQARAIAGGMAARGTAFILLPKGVLARLKSVGGETP